MIVIIISPGKIISTLLASRTRRFISKLSTSLVIFNLTQTWTYYYDPGSGFPFPSHKERSLQSRGAKYLRTRETHRGWKIEAIAAHDSIPLLPPPFHSYPLCLSRETNEFSPWDAIQSILWGHLGPSIRRRMRPTIRKSMRRICISILLRGKGKETRVCEQEVKWRERIVGRRNTKLFDPNSSRSTLTTFSWARWIFMDEWNLVMAI